MKPVGLLSLAHLELSALVTGDWQLFTHGGGFCYWVLEFPLNPAEEPTDTLFVISDTVGGAS